jgi:mono/diheme cytochrome c family protein
MKKTMMLLAMMAAFSMTAFAEDGATIYKGKCQMCHAAGGAGKPGMAPKLAGTAKSADQIVALLTKGGAPKGIHVKPLAGFSAADAAAVAAYVKSLK